jgi:hypothetical protein
MKQHERRVEKPRPRKKPVLGPKRMAPGVPIAMWTGDPQTGPRHP